MPLYYRIKISLRNADGDSLPYQEDIRTDTIPSDTYTVEGDEKVMIPKISITKEPVTAKSKSSIFPKKIMEGHVGASFSEKEFRERNSSTDSGLGIDSRTDYQHMASMVHCTNSCKPEKFKGKDVAVQYNYLTPMSEHLHDVYVVGEKLFPITDEKQQHELDWCKYGFRMIVPSGAVAVPCDIGVKAIIAGKFQLPEGKELASAVYAVSFSRKKLKSHVLVEVQHCIKLRNEKQSQYLTFVRADCSKTKRGHHYEFKRLEGGEFFLKHDYGKLSCEHFSLVAVAADVCKNSLQINGDISSPSIHEQAKISKSSIHEQKLLPSAANCELSSSPFPESEKIQKGQWQYQTHVYYTPSERINSWRMKFMATKKLESYIRHVENMHGTELWEPSDPIVFKFINDELVMELKPSQEHKGWKILLNSKPPTISKEAIDGSTEATPPFKFVEVIATDGPETDSVLHYGVPIRGISPESAEIFIFRQLSTTKPLAGISDDTSISKPSTGTALSLPKVLFGTKTCTDWFTRGACLGLSYETLECIGQTNARDASKCKVAMIGKWLCGMDDVSKEKGPSWKQLAYTLKELGYVTDAQEIQTKYCE